MHVISKAICNLSEDKLTLTTEASSAELPAGQWPHFVSVVDDRGEGFVFQRIGVDTDGEGEVMGMRYRTKNGAFGLLIIND